MSSVFNFYIKKKSSLEAFEVKRESFNGNRSGGISLIDEVWKYVRETKMNDQITVSKVHDKFKD